MEPKFLVKGSPWEGDKLAELKRLVDLGYSHRKIARLFNLDAKRIRTIMGNNGLKSINAIGSVNKEIKWEKKLIRPDLGPCWVVTSHHCSPYPIITSENNKRLRGHRWMYEKVYGAIPKGRLVEHKCDTPACVNPDHLELGTDFSNVRHCVERNRNAKGDSMPHSKLTVENVKRIRSASEDSKSLAKEFCVSRSTINRVKKKLRWKHV